MINKNYTLNLSKDELRMVLETLLYSSSVDIIGNFDLDYSKSFFELAKKIRSQHTDVLVENLEVITCINEDEHTDEAIELFPDISTQNIEDL
jgi:hypothetical protein